MAEDDSKEALETILSLGLGSSSNVGVGVGVEDINIDGKKKEAAVTMVSPSSTSSYHSDNNNNNGTEISTRKKRKFTPDQLNVLEHTFNRQKTIDQAQKDELAGRLNLATRQVEIWFQNRRARQKQQETGKEYEMLKEKYESVLAENMQLKQERHELRKHLMALTGAAAAAATTTSIPHTQLCPNCGSSYL